MACVVVDSGDGLGEIAQALPIGCKAVIVQPRVSWTSGLIESVRRQWDGLGVDGRLSGLTIVAGDDIGSGRAFAESLQPDFVVEPKVTPGWPHQWALHGGASVADDGFDFALLPLDAVAHAAEVSPPDNAASKPWFAVVTSLDDARQAIAAGATRLAWVHHEPSWWQRVFGRAANRLGDDLDSAGALLQEAWRKAHPDDAAIVDQVWRGGGPSY